MSRLSNDDFDDDGVLRNGFDYDLQVWVVDYKICPCTHPKYMKDPYCCNQDRFAGQDIREVTT